MFGTGFEVEYLRLITGKTEIKTGTANARLNVFAFDRLSDMKSTDNGYMVRQGSTVFFLFFF